MLAKILNANRAVGQGRSDLSANLDIVPGRLRRMHGGIMVRTKHVRGSDDHGLQGP